MTDSKLTDVTGIGIAKAKLLESHGISSVVDLMNCSLHELCKVPGIKEISANILKSNAKHLLDNNKVSNSAQQTTEDVQENEINSISIKVKDSKDKKKKQKGKQKGKQKNKKKKIKGKDKKKTKNVNCIISSSKNLL